MWGIKLSQVSMLKYLVPCLATLFIGVWFGYDRALKNQIYFDAPVKISLYNAVLEKNSSQEFLEGAIIQELGLMKYMEDKTTPFLLNHPAHHGMVEAYDKYSLNLDSLPQVIKAREFIRTYNKGRKEMGGNDVPPIR